MSAIELTNGVMVDISSLAVCIDPTNLIVSQSKTAASHNWTATQDCIVGVQSSGTSYSFWVNDERFSWPQFAYVRQGDKVTASVYISQYATYTSTIKGYGLK